MVEYKKQNNGVVRDAIIKLKCASSYDIRTLQLEICNVIQCYNPEMLGGVKDIPFYWLLRLLEDTLPTEDEYQILQEFQELKEDTTLADLQEWFKRNKEKLQSEENRI